MERRKISNSQDKERQAKENKQNNEYSQESKLGDFGQRQGKRPGQAIIVQPPTHYKTK